MMKHILYTITMPNVGSWNGKFSGADNFYGTVRSYPSKSDVPAKVLSKKSFYYNLGDGWGASVSCEEIPTNKKSVIMKRSQGFMGYDWMIHEIEHYGRIRTLREQECERLANRQGDGK